MYISIGEGHNIANKIKAGLIFGIYNEIRYKLNLKEKRQTEYNFESYNNMFIENFTTRVQFDFSSRYIIYITARGV